jgi:predicted Fe-Mo cluster-binding NifX family protein
MKIAIVSDDGETISQHFGRAQQYVVVTVEDGHIEKRETRDKFGHMHFEGEQGHEEDRDHHHGPEAEHRHGQMIEPIADCEVLLAGGMGGGAMQSLLASNIRPILTDIKSVDDAVKAYVEGRLENRESACCGSAP